MSIDFFGCSQLRTDISEKLEQVYKSPKETCCDSFSLLLGHRLSGKSIVSQLKHLEKWKIHTTWNEDSSVLKMVCKEELSEKEESWKSQLIVTEIQVPRELGNCPQTQEHKSCDYYIFSPYDVSGVSVFFSLIGKIKAEIGKAISMEYCSDGQPAEYEKEVAELSQSISNSMKRHETEQADTPAQTYSQYKEVEVKEQKDNTQKLSIKDRIKNSISNL